MTTTTKKSSANTRGKSKMPLPTSAGKATIGGTEYVLIPSAEFEDWYIDQMLAAVAADRLKTERQRAIPWEEVVARLQKTKTTKAKGK